MSISGQDHARQFQLTFLLLILPSHDDTKDICYVREEGCRYLCSLCIRPLLHSYFDGESYDLYLLYVESLKCNDFWILSM